MGGPNGNSAWRRLLVLMAVLSATFIVFIRVAVAEDAVVPLRTQAELIVKLAEYDRSLVSRPGPRVVLILHNKSLTSVRTAQGIAGELRTFERIAGLAHVETFVDFDSVSDVRRRVQSEKAHIIYICPGLEDRLPAIAEALAGLTILSIGAGPNDANLGVVVEFQIHSGRTQLLVNLKQALRQNVQMRAEFLKIAKVIR